MSRAPASATGRLKRYAAVYLVCFVGVGVIMHLAFPGFDFLAVLGSFTNLVGTYPAVGIILFGLIILLFVAAKVSDLFS